MIIKTKRKSSIQYDNLEMAEYLKRNIKEMTTKYITKVRSGTLEIKNWSQWKYSDNLCVGCETKEETMSHFMECKEYNEKQTPNEILSWKDIYKNDMDQQIKIAEEVERRFKIKELKLHEAGRDSDPSSQLQDSSVL